METQEETSVDVLALPRRFLDPFGLTLVGVGKRDPGQR